MKRLLTYCCILFIIACFNENMEAQSDFSIRKELTMKNNSSTQKSIELFILHLVNNTNGEVIYQSDINQTTILKGQLPLILSHNSADLAARFNGEVNYKLTISNQDDKLVLTFDELSHHSNESIDGFDLDYGRLKANKATQKSAIYYNYDFLHEDYRRLHRFSEDDRMASAIHQQTLNKIDQLLAIAGQ